MESIHKQLTEVLCDPSGKVCINGSDEDKLIVLKALNRLRTLEDSLGIFIDYLNHIKGDE